MRAPAAPGFSQGIHDVLLRHLEVVTGPATWSTQENPLQVLSVTNDVTADGRAVRTDIGGMLRHRRGKVGDGIPIRGMRRKFVAVYMAQRTGWPGPADAVQVRPVTIGIGAGGSERIVLFDKIPMEGIRVGSPLVGVYGVLVAEVALGAGHLRNPPPKSAPWQGAQFSIWAFASVLCSDGSQPRGCCPLMGSKSDCEFLSPHPASKKRESSNTIARVTDAGEVLFICDMSCTSRCLFVHGISSRKPGRSFPRSYVG